MAASILNTEREEERRVGGNRKENGGREWANSLNSVTLHSRCSVQRIEIRGFNGPLIRNDSFTVMITSYASQQATNNKCVKD